MKESIQMTPKGLYSPAGDFYIDPDGTVDRAVITHGHSDHARWGSKFYLSSAAGKRILQERIGTSSVIETLGYGEKRKIGEALVSLHPAGHILGSSQVRIEHKGKVCVVSGDYKTERDETCASYEPVRCDVFVTESTFAIPIYQWKPPEKIFSEINEWWRLNKAHGKNSLVMAYALGKAQRILSGADASIGPIYVHGAVKRFVEIYESEGVKMPAVKYAEGKEKIPGETGALIVAPPSVLGTPWLRKFQPLSTGFASGWMQVRGAKRRKAVDRGFALSDHADWNGLLLAVKETGASKVIAMHGSKEIFAKFLNEKGIETDYFGHERPGGESESLET